MPEDTFSVWIGEDGWVEEFDQEIGSRPDYSRSKEVKKAMALYVKYREALEDTGYEPGNIRQQRLFMYRAIRDKAIEEQQR